MKIICTIVITLVLLGCHTLSAQEADAAQTRPNILLIMSDDMGYSDLGCYGGEIQTPNLDALAASGLRYTQFYNTGRCCPTRASLLSGLYAHQAGIGRMVSDDHQPGYRGDLSYNAVTIAEVLKSEGYRTYMAGKWHVTKQLMPDGDKSNWPMQRGFDRFYGTIIGAGSFFDPWTLTRDNDAITPDNDPLYKPQTYYYTTAISDNAAMFLNDHRRDHAAQPFFMYVAYTAAHWPMHALPQDIAKYEGKYEGGYQKFREQRFAKMKQLGLIDERWELSPQADDWANVPQPLQAWEMRCMEVYAAMVDCMDQGIGKIVSTLKANGQFDNTLILFLQDNGGCSEAMGRGKPKQPPAAQREPMGKDELQTRMVPTHSRSGLPVIQGAGVMPGPSETYHGYGRNWANVSNTPFREYKSFNHEGGISTPLIAHWPKGIKAQGQLRQQPGHIIDIMATCVDLSGATYPKLFKGQSIMPMEGLSLAKTFEADINEERVLLWEHYGRRAIRKGDWKLVSLGLQKPWELYDLQSDRSEMHDLSDKMPDKVKELGELWESEAKRTLIYPMPKQ